MSQTLRLYPLSNFTFSTKEAQPEEDPSVAARLQRLQNNYEDFGMRRTVEGVLVVHVSRGSEGARERSDRGREVSERSENQYERSESISRAKRECLPRPS
jgi:hypothetical protein